MLEIQTIRNILFPAIILLAACGRPECHNTNPVFDKNAPGSKEYNDELVKQLHKRNKDELQYWIKEYVVKDGAELMSVWIQKDDLCAVAMMDITGNKRLENYRKVKGVSYSGAGLNGLQYSIEQDSNGYRFVFKDVDRIVD